MEIKGLLDKFDLKVLRGFGSRMIRRIVQDIRNYRTGTPLREQFLTVMVLVFGLTVAIGGGLTIKSLLRTAAQSEFEGPAAEFTAILSNKFDRYLEFVQSVSVWFNNTENADRWKFQEFVGESLADYPGIRALEWIPVVPEKERKAYEKRAFDDGLFDFRFTEIDSSGQILEAAKRDFYLPVYYVEPFKDGGDALGTDLGADPAALAVLERARDEGIRVADRGASRSGNPQGMAQIVVVQPVFQSEIVPFTVAERRQKLIGYIRGVFRIGGMIEAALPGLTAPPGLDIYLFDQLAKTDNRLVYFHPSPLRRSVPNPLSERAASQGLSISKLYTFADWRWSIVVKPVPSHFTQNIDSAAWVFVALTILVTALLEQLLISSQTRTREIERSVDERTAALQSEIAERKRVEKELRASKEQAEIANRAKSEFLAMMSHELRTPLNAVIGFAEVMSEEFFGPIGSEKYRRYAEDIHMSGSHLLSLINDILDLSKIEANQLELNDDVVDIAETWRAVRSILQDNVAAAELSLKDEVPETLPRLRADGRAFRQILINLLSNAVKFTPEGGQIIVKAEINDQGCFVLSVDDTGIGISERDLEAVLQPFKQVDSSLARKYEGTGLGLPLTQRLVEMHDGRMQIHSTLGSGTKVEITLEPDRIIPDQKPAQKKRTPKNPYKSAKHSRISVR